MDRAQLAFAYLLAFCGDDKNKPFVYHVSLALWTLLNVTFIGVLAITASGTSTAAFWLPLMFYVVLLGGATHLLLRCAFQAFTVMAADPALHADKPGDWADPRDTLSDIH